MTIIPKHCPASAKGSSAVLAHTHTHTQDYLGLFPNQGI